MVKNPKPAAGGDAKPDETKERLPAVPDAACAEAVRAFLADWNADRPADAAGGGYGATSRDRWAEQSFEGIPDGYVFAGGWAFVFEGGRFVGGGALDQMPATFVPAGQAVSMAATG